MKNRQLHRLIYHLRRNYLTLNGAVIAVAAAITLSWIWGSLGMMERNYTLQNNLDRKQQQLKLAELQTRQLELEQNYYKTYEYQELAARNLLNKGQAGEKLLIIPEHGSTALSPPPSASSAA